MDPGISRADNSWPLLHQASWYGDHEKVEAFLQTGADVHGIDDEGETALHQAAWRGHTEITHSLLMANADPDARDYTGQTPLHHAASTGSETAVIELLTVCADPRIEDDDGRKPHSLAEENFHHSTAEILREKETQLFGHVVLPDTDSIPRKKRGAPSVDVAVVPFLPLHEGTSLSFEEYGQSSTSSTSRIRLRLNSGEHEFYFLKTGPNGDVFAGEYESLSAIHKAVPSFCPRPIAHSKFLDLKRFFLLTEYIDMEAIDDNQPTGNSLAQKLAHLHSTPVPIPEGYDAPVYGFHLPTYVGGTRQPNIWSPSWADFFGETRLRFVERSVEKARGPDPELHALLDRVIQEVVPRLLGPDHLGDETGIQPSLVHGDLWAGNKTRGKIGRNGAVEDLVFDPGSFYAHSEYELGIMRMFGGFSSGFFKEYHRYRPKTEPVSEYGDRVELYQL